jgi:hypothetical protein
MHLKDCVSVTCTVLLIVGCGPTGVQSIPTLSAVEAQPEITLGEAFVLRVEQTAALGGGVGVSLTFEAVREDSRCPVGVSCIWAGDAVVAVRVDDSRGGTVTLELHTNARFDADAERGEHVVRLLELSPTPRVGSTIPIDQYEATLVVTRRAA